jgi:hypothetical protein
METTKNKKYLLEMEEAIHNFKFSNIQLEVSESNGNDANITIMNMEDITYSDCISLEKYSESVRDIKHLTDVLTQNFSYKKIELFGYKINDHLKVNDIRLDGEYISPKLVTDFLSRYKLSHMENIIEIVETINEVINKEYKTDVIIKPYRYNVGNINRYIIKKEITNES